MSAVAELGLTGISYGIDKIPDHHIDKIPVLRPSKEEREEERRVKKEREREQRREARRNRQDSTSDEAEVTRTSSNRDVDGSREYDYSQRYQSHTYSPPPQGQQYPPAGGNYPTQPRPPSPVSPISTRSRDYQSKADYSYSSSRGAPTDATDPRDIPDSDKQLTPRAENQIMESQPYFPPPPASEYRRYDPANYQPSRPDDYDDDRRDSNGRSRRSDYDDEDDQRSDHKKHHERKRSGSRSGSGIRGKVEKNLDISERGLATGALGAVAGGVLAHHFGKSHLATAAGAIIGGVGANAWEARENRHHADREKEKPHRHHRTRSQDYSSSSRRDSRDSRRDDDYYYSPTKAVAAPPDRDEYDGYSRGGASRSVGGYDNRGDSDDDSYTARRRSRRERDY